MLIPLFRVSSVLMALRIALVLEFTSIIICLVLGVLRHLQMRHRCLASPVKLLTVRRMTLG